MASPKYSLYAGSFKRIGLMSYINSQFMTKIFFVANLFYLVWLRRAIPLNVNQSVISFSESMLNKTSTGMSETLLLLFSTVLVVFLQICIFNALCL